MTKIRRMRNSEELLQVLVPIGRAPFGQHKESRPLAWTPGLNSGQVQHRKSAIHGLSVTLCMLRVKSDKSDWFWSQSIVFTNPFKTDLARGRDSWCWPKGARPLGTRMVLHWKATRRNMVAKRTQHVAPNNVAICCVEMLWSFGRGLTFCSRLMFKYSQWSVIKLLKSLENWCPSSKKFLCYACNHTHKHMRLLKLPSRGFSARIYNYQEITLMISCKHSWIDYITRVTIRIVVNIKTIEKWKLIYDLYSVVRKNLKVSWEVSLNFYWQETAKGFPAIYSIAQCILTEP